MPHRMLRSAATVLLASAPLLAAMPAQAAPQQALPCAVGLQKIDNALTSVVTLSVQCDQARTLGVRITAGDTELASQQLTVQAHVQQSITVVAPRVPKVCVTLQTDGESSQLCTPGGD